MIHIDQSLPCKYIRKTKNLEIITIHIFFVKFMVTAHVKFEIDKLVKTEAGQDLVSDAACCRYKVI